MNSEASAIEHKGVLAVLMALTILLQFSRIAGLSAINSFIQLNKIL
jgi:hypothetical protein